MVSPLFTRVEIHSRRALLRLVGLTRRRVATVRLGSRYGGWVIPDGYINGQSLVVSAGVGEDTTFDEELIELTGCRILGIDPTPRAVAHVLARDLGPRFTLCEVAIAGSDGRRLFFPPSIPEHVSYSLVNDGSTAAPLSVETCRLTTILAQFSPLNRDPHMVKLDIEGAETEVLKDMSTNGPRPGILCLEFDRPGLHHTVRTLLVIRRMGYRIVAVEGLNASFML